MRNTWITISLVLLVSCASGGGEKSGPENFGTVVENGIYRGAQPTIDDYAGLRTLGIRTILKLNSSRMAEETAEASRAGIRLIHIPFDAGTIGTEPTCEQVADALAVLTDESNWPVFVHCSRGRDRAGYVVGLYRLLVEGWTWEQIDAELARYGHVDGLRRSYPQITKELESGASTCRVSLTTVSHSLSHSASE